MTITHPPPPAKLTNDTDPWMSIDHLLEKYPFLQGGENQPRRRIYRLRELGHFPQHDGRAGRLLLWRQSTIEAWLQVDTNDRELSK
jgi:hypothetical protein